MFPSNVHIVFIPAGKNLSNVSILQEVSSLVYTPLRSAFKAGWTTSKLSKYKNVVHGKLAAHCTNWWGKYDVLA